MFLSCIPQLQVVGDCGQSVCKSVTLFLSQVSGLRSQDSGLGTDVAVGAVNVVGAVGLMTQVSGLRSQDLGLRT